ncbi:Ribophorin I [Rhodocollybia butyracea]|uniref:Dolichyl-diphosphooligosaccharide--protein glycosyltransferase subunit 1 n=1 Tax=Rhodocollybia butyracea TaxID=206335 RepID=A0A9P5Q732_9AGAR|nr:Ribophorin I [Rhodocollybia butyracea]
MLRLWNAISCLLLASALPALSAQTQSFENSAIVRTIELGGSLVHVTTTFAVKALKADASVYTITIPAEEIYITNWLEVKVKGNQEPLTVTYSGSAGKAHNLDVSLEKPLEVGETINLVLETVQTHATWPWPPQAAQKEEQALKYQTPLFVLSPYITNVQRTKLKASSPRIISHTTPENVDDFTLENPVTKSGATVTYGPYNNVPVSANQEFIEKYQQSVQLHYSHDYTVLEVLKLRRSAEISHWGANLNIQDDIILHNAGPELKGQFSRLDYQTQLFYGSSVHHFLTSFTVQLPGGIRNTYYYDQIGNVSTSRLRTAPSPARGQKNAQSSVLELWPRYPIMGGWNYTYTLGWDAPLADSASYDASTGKYIVSVPVMTEIPGSVVNDAELTIILPEGATDVEYVGPFPAHSDELSTHVTYLDTVGRPSITFKYKNLTNKHVKPIYVSYKVPLTAHLRKPMAVATVLLSLFTFAMIARRVDLTIHKKTTKDV